MKLQKLDGNKLYMRLAHCGLEHGEREKELWNEISDAVFCGRPYDTYDALVELLSLLENDNANQ